MGRFSRPPCAPPRLGHSDAPVVERLGAAYRVMHWRNRDEPITRRDAFDYVAALRVSPGCLLPYPRCNRRPNLCEELAIVVSHTSRFSLLPPQVIFGSAHDAREWTAHMPEAMDGQFINEQARAGPKP